MLASFEVQQIEQAEVIGFRVIARQPALGLVQVLPTVTEVMVAKEQLPREQ
jgi:hypothetical protein